MKAYCINLTRRLDRKAHMIAQLTIAGVNAEFIPAVDGLNEKVLHAAVNNNIVTGRKRVTPGAYACFQSHRIIWEKLAQGVDSHIMILEDDMFVGSGLDELLKEDWIPFDADIVKLESRLVRTQLGREHSMSSTKRRLYRLHSSHFGTGCYIISKHAARRLLEATLRPVNPIDETIFDDSSDIFKSLVIYQMVPAPTIQGDRLSGTGEKEEWKTTSIELSPNEGTNLRKGERSLVSKVIRRLRGEAVALSKGWVYRYIPFE